MPSTAGQKIEQNLSSKQQVREEWKLPHRALLSRLAAGWAENSVDVARDFVSRWASCLGVDVDIRQTGDSFLAFDADLSAIRLMGMHDARCLLVSGNPEAAKEAVESFWWRNNSPGNAMIIVAANDHVENIIRESLPRNRHTILGASQALSFLDDPSPMVYLKSAVRSQVSARRLIPFDTEHPIEGHMFCGRVRMLHRLLEDERVNFAVAGPGRIGKTSLLRRFLYEVLRSGDKTRASRHYIDLMPCSDRTPNGLATFIGLKIDGSSRASHLTCDRIELFLKFHRSQHGRPLDLILDETDEFLHLATFEYLANAARKNLCRVILAGRGNLLHTALNEKSRLQNRIELLRLDPLTDAEVESLFFPPLKDLGFDFVEPDRVFAQISRLTGNLPQYVQYYGRRICELLIDRDSPTVNPELVCEIRDEFETAQLFSASIFEVKKPRTRFAALALLGTAHRALNLPQVQGILHSQGLKVTLDEVWEIANELVIQNVLAWNQGRFQVANDSLPYYAHAQEFFSTAMREARGCLNPPAKST